MTPSGFSILFAFPGAPPTSNAVVMSKEVVDVPVKSMAMPGLSVKSSGSLADPAPAVTGVDRVIWVAESMLAIVALGGMSLPVTNMPTSESGSVREVGDFAVGRVCNSS